MINTWHLASAGFAFSEKIEGAVFPTYIVYLVYLATHFYDCMLYIMLFILENID